MSTALIMAGGRSERMRRSYGPIAKPLVPVAGVPLLERNLYALFRAGVRDIYVALPANAEPDLRAWAAGRGSALARAAGARLEVLVEASPRGNIGCAGDLYGRADPLLVVFADNLTTLDLADILAEHRRRNAVLTLAAHEEPFHMPFGELTIAGGRVVSYVEKPRKHYLVCSAISVLGAPALHALMTRAQEPVGLSDVFHMLDDRGLPVSAYVHRAPWIDVNDAAAVKRAGAIVAADRAAFDCWSTVPDRNLCVLAALGSSGIALTSAYGGNAPATLPTIEVGPAGPCAAAKELAARLRLVPGSDWRPLGMFDDIDEPAAQVVRHHLFAADCASDTRVPRKINLAWVAGETLAAASLGDSCLRRALSFLDMRL